MKAFSLASTVVLDEEEAVAMMAVLGQNKLCARLCGLQCGVDSFWAAHDHELVLMAEFWPSGGPRTREAWSWRKRR